MLICLLCHFSKQYKTQPKPCLAFFLKCLTVTMSFQGQIILYNSYCLWHSMITNDNRIHNNQYDDRLGFHILHRDLLMEIHLLPTFLKVIRFFYWKSCTNQWWNQSWFCYCLQSYLVLSSILNIKSRSEKSFKTWRFHIFHKYWA